MSSRQIDLKEVPGIEAIQERLVSIDPDLSVSAAGYDFDRTLYVLELSGQGREGRVQFSRELLDDVRDNRTPPGSRYSQELHAKLTEALREVIESNGLISFSEKALKYKLLQFVYKESKEREHVEKYNTIGRDAQGDFERWLRITLTRDEKETLIWIWGDLLRLRLITPTGKDLVIPDDWVRVTDKGIAAIEGKSYVEYDEHEVFITKGEVYTAYRTISNIMSQGQMEILVTEAQKIFGAKYDPADELWLRVCFPPSERSQAAGRKILSGRRRARRASGTGGCITKMGRSGERSLGLPEEVPQPMLVVNGSNDVIIYTVNSFNLQQNLPNAQRLTATPLGA